MSEDLDLKTAEKNISRIVCYISCAFLVNVLSLPFVSVLSGYLGLSITSSFQTAK